MISINSFDPMASFPPFIDSLKNGDHTMIINEALSKAMRIMFCKLLLSIYHRFKDVHNWATTDPEIKAHMMTSIMRQGLRGLSLIRQLRLKIRTAVEVGMFVYFEKVFIEKFNFGNILEVLDYSHLPLDRQQQADYLRNCYSPTVIYNNFDVE